MSLIEVLNSNQKIRGIETHIINLNPSSAKYILENCNKHNRKLRESAVLRYKQEILNDEWRLTASGIGIDSNGVLCDGQHRLKAIIDSGRSIPCIIVTGLSPKSQEKIDRHAKRTMIDSFKLAGYAHNSIEINISKFLAEIKINGVVDSSHNIPVSDSEVKSALECHNKAIKNIAPSSKLHTKGLSRTGFLSAMVLYNELDELKSIKFYDQVLSGVMLNQNDPAMRLRKYLIGETQNGQKIISGMMVKFSDFRKTIYAINAFHVGRKITRLGECNEFDFKDSEISKAS